MGMEYTIITKQVGERLHQLRRAKGVSQESLALDARISPNYLGQLERGLRTPTIETLARICNALEVDLADFFLFEDTADETKHALAYKTIKTSLDDLPTDSALQLSLIIKELSTFTHRD